MLRKSFIPVILTISLALGLIPALSSYANAESRANTTLSWLPSKKLVNYKLPNKTQLKLNGNLFKNNSTSNKTQLKFNTSSSMWADLLTFKQPTKKTGTPAKTLFNQSNYSKTSFKSTLFSSLKKATTSNKNTGYTAADKKRIVNNINNNLFPKKSPSSSSTSTFKRTTIKNPISQQPWAKNTVNVKSLTKPAKKTG